MIGQETIDRVREQANLISLAGERVKLQRRGRSWVGLCPFHKEKTPSFHVNEERGFYHCFGCGVSGDAIQFVRETEGLSFVEAIRYIAERQGIEVIETGSELERRQEAEARRRREELYEIGGAAAAFFERCLDAHPLASYARRELERRGLVPTSATDSIAEALRAFRVGYAPYGWDALAVDLRSHGLSHRAAEALGLLLPRRSGSGHYDRFRHRLMFAVTDLQGRIIAFSGRALDEPAAKDLAKAGLEPMGGEPGAKYVNSPESPLYKKREAVFGLHQARQAIREHDRAVLVEGNFDVVGLHARGLRNVVAPLGTSFTAEQGRQIRRFTSHVTLLFDGDDAGRRAVKQARDTCNEVGLEARVARLPDDKDPDDIVKAGGAAAIERHLGAARGMLEYLIETTLDTGFAADDARARAAKIREISELLASEEDPTVRAMAQRHADAIAERLGIADVTTFRALASAVQRSLARRDGPQADGTARTGSRGPLPPPPERARSRDRREDIGREILGALLDFPGLLEHEEVAEALALLDGSVAVAIAALRHCPAAADRINPEQLLAKLSPSIHPFAAARLAAPRHERVDDARTELLKNVEKLKRLELSRQKSEAVDALQRVQSSGDFDHELALLREQERRARQRYGV